MVTTNCDLVHLVLLTPSHFGHVRALTKIFRVKPPMFLMSKPLLTWENRFFYDNDNIVPVKCQLCYK